MKFQKKLLKSLIFKFAKKILAYRFVEWLLPQQHDHNSNDY